MKSKRIFSLIICLAMLFCTCGCNNSSQEVSVVTEYEYQYVSGEGSGNSSGGSGSSGNSSGNTSNGSSSNDQNDGSSYEDNSYYVDDDGNSSNDNGSGDNAYQYSNPSNPGGYESYAFTKLSKVEYSVVKDTYLEDAEYKITSVITDVSSDVLPFTTFSCNVSGVTVDGANVTVPNAYRKANDSITLTATHSNGKSMDFEIKFDKWEVIFEDDFNGTTLDSKKWKIATVYGSNKGFKNVWSADMIKIENGCLVSTVTNVGTGTSQSTASCKSGAVTTKGLFEGSYGYYEARIKPHQVKGMWDAFWIVAGDMDSSNAVDDDSGLNGVEIDICENLKGLGVCHMIHWDGYGTKTQAEKDGDKLVYEGYKATHIHDGNFHTFALSWSPEEYIFYVDGVETLRVNPNDSKYSNMKAVCTESGHIRLTSEVGTWNATKSGGQYVFSLSPGQSSSAYFDYVRVYSTNK